MLNVEIDKLTPCLERISTGEIVNTFYLKAEANELTSLRGWSFKWSDFLQKEHEVYKLTVEGDDRIQGLVAITNRPKDYAVYVDIAESAPHNLGKDKEYLGVGGHLFAIAVKRSIELGYDGFCYMDAKNLRLVSHYAKTLGATFIGTPRPYRMAIEESAARELLDIYSFRSD